MFHNGPLISLSPPHADTLSLLYPWRARPLYLYFGAIADICSIVHNLNLPCIFDKHGFQHSLRRERTSGTCPLSDYSSISSRRRHPLTFLSFFPFSLSSLLMSSSPLHHVTNCLSLSRSTQRQKKQVSNHHPNPTSQTWPLMRHAPSRTRLTPRIAWNFPRRPSLCFNAPCHATLRRASPHLQRYTVPHRTRYATPL